jgi:hypothetical protein
MAAATREVSEIPKNALKFGILTSVLQIYYAFRINKSYFESSQHK